MKVVVDHEEITREVLSKKSKNTIATWYNCIDNKVFKGTALKFGEFWNYEILEFYIMISQLEVQIYYFREFIPGKYVLVQTRKDMDRKEDSQIVCLLELLNKHKLRISEFHDSTSSSLAKMPVNDLVDNTNFDDLILVRNNCTIPYDEAKFFTLNSCKEVIAARDNTSGYASVAKSIRKSTTHIIQQLAEHYQNEFDE